jgi:hypothetical protein
MAENDYLTKLDEWHMELAILAKALSHEFGQVEDEDQGAVFHVLGGQLSHLVESCPFPRA